MPNDYIYTGRQPPRPQEFQRWAEQADLFAYHPADHNDPREWGIPQHLRPPADCVEQVLAVFKREMGHVTINRMGYLDPMDEPKIIPMAKFHIVMACAAHFLWFRTREGARYIMGLHGVEEVAPFAEGYVYYFIRQGQRFEVSERTGMQIRVFQARKRTLEPPIATGNGSDVVIAQMRAILAAMRSPYASDPNDTSWYAQDGLFRWVATKIFDWLVEPKIDYEFPYRKGDRISGPQWARTVVRSDGQPLYHAIGQVEAFKERAYRIEDRNGGVVWCGRSQVDHFGKIEVAASEGMSEEQVRSIWMCESCNQVRTCTSLISIGNGQQTKHCKHCIGHFVEKDTRPSLDWCTYQECKGCPDYIRSQDDLVQIRSRLNQGARFPVQRR